tara:strand:- start:47 stop:463 length:417 start_codon:yes stop_codon:yes gene_type:complete
MPFYDFKCPDGCGYFADIFVPLAEHGKTTCPECQSLLVTVISEVALVGPMPSKPLVVKQIGKSFDNGADWRQYQKENPGFEILSAESKAWDNHKTKAREKVEATAKRQGYRDLADKQQQRKKDKAKRSGKVDKKVYIH